MRGQTKERTGTEAGRPVKVVVVRSEAEQKRKLHDLIECCAFELYEGRGKEQGHAVEDWRNAELKVLCTEGQCALGYIEQDKEIEVEAAVEDFKPEELQVCVGPGRITVIGCRNRLRCGTCDEFKGELHPVFGSLDLPAKFDASKATARLKSGMLHVVLPKIAQN